MTTLISMINRLAPFRRSQGPTSNMRAEYNNPAFNMNNYIIEMTPTKSTDETKDVIEKYEDDSVEDKKYNKSLLTRQKKPEVVEQPTLGSNPNDLLDYYM